MKIQAQPVNSWALKCRGTDYQIKSTWAAMGPKPYELAYALIRHGIMIGLSLSRGGEISDQLLPHEKEILSCLRIYQSSRSVLTLPQFFAKVLPHVHFQTTT